MNPQVATVEACSKKSKIKKKPYFDDCRWKTQNLLVEGNAFRSTRQDPLLRRLDGLWLQWALLELRHLSRLVAVQGEVVEKDITFEQNNVWRNNAYTAGLAFHG